MVQVSRQKPKATSDRLASEKKREIGQRVCAAKGLEPWGEQRVLLNYGESILEQAPNLA